MTHRQFGPYVFESSNENKIFFPDCDITKGDVIAYYEKIGEFMLPFLKDRPLTLHRFPDGIQAEGFIQQKAGEYFPDWIPRITISKEDGNITHHMGIRWSGHTRFASCPARRWPPLWNGRR